ncbi:MAG: amidohydrolase, partial [Cyclobacteriaceae bacterium]
MNRIIAKTFILLLVGSSLLAQEKNEEKWDVADPYGDWNFKKVQFTTNEGTWMNLDVSPDGKTLVFDLLGDIYSLPITGGKANPLRTGLPFEIQPRFSPDGRWISFTSDAGGGDNIWVMREDGSEVRQVTKESFRLLNNADWMPDGNYLVARKHFTSRRSLGAGEMWQYHISGGEGLQLTTRKNDQQDVNEPSVSPDARYLYFSEDMAPGGGFEYNRDPNKQIYLIKRYDFETGETRVMTGGPGGAARPQVSPDGKKLAFIKRIRTKTVLYIHDLETGEEWPVYDQLNKDQQTAWAIFGVYPGFDWMPDNESLVIWAGGKIKKINTQNLAVHDIPFTVDVDMAVAERVHFKHPIPEDTFPSKMIKDAVTSPDGKLLAFTALGYVWTKKLPDGKPQRLTSGMDFEGEPAFSPDGDRLIYVSWSDMEKGAIHAVNLKNGKSQKLTAEKGIFRNPAFSPDGRKIVFRKESGNMDQGRTFSKNPGLYVLNLESKEYKWLIEDGDFPQFDKKGERIFFQTGGKFSGNLTKELKSVDLNGKDERIHIKSKYANRLVPSPNNQWIAFIHLHKAYVAPMVMNGQTIDLDNKSTSLPVSQLAKDAGINLHWSKDSHTVYWTMGDRYFSNKLSDKFEFLGAAAKDSLAKPDEGLPINLQAKVDQPEGKIAFTGARIISMEGNEVIEKGTVLIEGNRILAVGSDLEIGVPKEAKTYDMRGKTIMPGIVDAHAHIGAFRDGLTVQSNWQLYANLAFGVTTAHDPSANTST